MMKTAISFWMGGLMAGVLVLNAGCAGFGRGHRAGHFPHKPGKFETVLAAVIVSKAAPSPAPARSRKQTKLTTSETVYLSLPSWPQGATGTITLTVKCYQANIFSSDGEYAVSSESNPLSVFPGSADSDTVSFTSNQLTDSVSVDLSGESGRFFFIGTVQSVNQSGNTYTFSGGTILTEP